MRKLYKPKEDIEHIYQLTALAMIISADRRLCMPLIKNEFFAKPLLSDLKYCLREIQRVDPDFLRLAYRFARYTLNRARDIYGRDRYEITELIAARAIQ